MKKDTSKHSSKQLDRSAKAQTKKISLGGIVQKTVEVLKKPFTKKEKKNAREEELATSSLISSSQSDSTEKKPTRKRRPKKEQIAVDYMTPKVLDDSKDLPSKRRHGKKNAGEMACEDGQKRKPLSKKQRQLLDQQDGFDTQDEDGQYGSSGGGSGDSGSAAQALAGISGEVNGFFYTNDKFLDRIEDREILKYIKARYPKFMQVPEDLQTSKKAIIEMLGDSQFMEGILKHYDMSIYDFFKFLFRLEPDWFKGSFLKRVQKAMKYKKYATAAKRTSYVERKRARLKQLRKAGYCISRARKASQVPTTGLQWKSRAN